MEVNRKIQQFKKYLDKHGIKWRPTEEWSLIFYGNHPEGIFISSSDAPMDYIKKHNLYWEYRGHYTAVYVYPKE